MDVWARLVQERARSRTSTAEWVAGILRDQIIEGEFPPGMKLSEKEITTHLKISRNPLREAFRLLAHENLVVYELNRGVSVRIPDPDDVRDLYRVRRVIECAAIRDVKDIPEDAIDDLKAAVSQAEKAAAQGRWPEVGTANLRFHRAIVGLIGSPRIDQLMRRVWAELRMVWHVMENPREIYEPYVAWNKRIMDRVIADDMGSAVKLLDEYLADAEERLVVAYAKVSPPDNR